MLLDISNVCFERERKKVVCDVSITLQQGEIGSIVGPSGCGKTTLMRGIAGFERPTSGTIKMNDNILSSSAYAVVPEKRGVSMVFQDIILFPHLSVARNIAFGLRNWSAKKRTKRVKELLEIVGLPNFGERAPHCLSGGEQQRVALAQALAPKPNLLLMDEAFSNLDVQLRRSLVSQVRDILKHEKISAILVTHDHQEAFAIADKVGVMEDGCLHQWDTPFNLYHRPRNAFTAKFIGEGTLMSAIAIEEHKLFTPFGIKPIRNNKRLKKGQEVKILLRPDDVLHDDDSEIKGKVLAKSFRGSHFHYKIRLDNGEVLFCLADSHHNHQIGESIGINPNIEHLVIFHSEDEIDDGTEAAT